MKNTLITLVFLLLNSLVNAIFSQQPSEAKVYSFSRTSEENSNRKYPSRNQYLAIDFNFGTKITLLESYKGTKSLNINFTLRPNRYKSPNYFLGLCIGIGGTDSKETDGVSNAPTRKLDCYISMMSFGIAQRFYLPSYRPSVLPFIEVDLNMKEISNYCDVEYSYISTAALPFGGSYTFQSSALDLIYDEKDTRFSLNVAAGYYFELLGQRGLFVKVGFDTGNKFKIIDPQSITVVSGDNYSYQTTYTRSLIYSFGLGLML